MGVGGDFAIEEPFTELSVGAAFAGRELAVAVVDKDFHFAVVLRTAQRFHLRR